MSESVCSTVAALEGTKEASCAGEQSGKKCSCRKRGWHRCSTLSDAAVSCRLKMRKVVLMVKVLKAWKGFRKKFGSLSATSLASTMSSMLGPRAAAQAEGSDAGNESTSRLRMPPDPRTPSGAAHRHPHCTGAHLHVPVQLLCCLLVFFAR